MSEMNAQGLRLQLTMIVVGAVIWPGIAATAQTYVPFEGAKKDWHGYDRYDFLMDEQTLEITPYTAGADEGNGIQGEVPGKRRCVVVVPKKPAGGNPWSWRGCYWDHQPQTEVELLKQGFHIAYITANHQLKPNSLWDAWFAFLTEKHGLSLKPAFIGMSRGGEYAYTWATAHPANVSCIYADNPGCNPEILKRLPDLVQYDVPLLHICGSLDPLLGKNSSAIETIYRQLGGRISVLIKEGAGHHPHSVRHPQPTVEFIVKSVEAGRRATPDYAGAQATHSSYYSTQNNFQPYPNEGTDITCRGPMFTACYDRYEFGVAGVEGAVTVIVPQRTAPGTPWVFRADYVNPDEAVDLALLANGFHIVTGPVPYNADGPQTSHWDLVYQHLTDAGFSSKPVLEGIGAAAGEVYAWAIANPDKVSCIYGQNPILRSCLAAVQPMDHLKPLADADIPLLHVCGSLDSHLNDNTRKAEKLYKDMGGRITVLVIEGKGHYFSLDDTEPVVDFIMRNTASVRASSGSSLFKLDYAGSDTPGRLQTAVTYMLWIPEGVKTVRGIIVHQHGAGTTASIEGSTAAYDLHWQALARKWDCALFASSYHVQNEATDLTPGGSEHWFDPRRGSEKTFLKALDEFAAQTGHEEINDVPWVLWGHSGGGIWADVMMTLYPHRVAAAWLRSGSAAMFGNRSEFPPTQVPDAVYAIPVMCNPGAKEKPAGPWTGPLETFQQYRSKGAPIGFAPDPRTGHECGDSRYLAIPFLDACMAMRLPDKGGKDQTLKPVDMSQAWLAPLLGGTAVPAADYTDDPKTAVWLPNEAVAKAWMEYVKTGAVSDSTPPPAPFDVQSVQTEQGIEITWNAEADFESGIRNFIVLRDGQELASIPTRPEGQFGRPLYQSMTYHDTPAQPLPKMYYRDAEAGEGKTPVYSIMAVNSSGLKSDPSEESKPKQR